jgi:hypothetical protein
VVAHPEVVLVVADEEELLEAFSSLANLPWILD